MAGQENLTIDVSGYPNLVTPTESVSESCKVSALTSVSSRSQQEQPAPLSTRPSIFASGLKTINPWRLNELLNEGARPDVLQVATRLNEMVIHQERALQARIVPDLSLYKGLMVSKTILTGLLAAYC